jgi:Flp pilus assembly protein TadG
MLRAWIKEATELRPRHKLPSQANRLKAFTRDIRGMTAVWFGLSILPIALLVLGGIDMTRASSEKAKLQNALDTAVLMAARSGQLTNDELDKMGDAALQAQLQASGSDFSTVTSTFSNGANDSVTGVAKAKVGTVGLGLMNVDYLKIEASTEVQRGMDESIELALVLDTTGSMSGARLTSLKSAANNLVKALTSDPKANVKIAVVPFAQYVNTGVARRNEPWMNVPADWTQPVKGSCWTQTHKTTCKVKHSPCVKYNDGVAYNSTCSSHYDCVSTELKPPITHCSKDSTTKHTYHGCTGSPAYPRNVSDSDPTRRYPGYLNMTCGSVMTPLTSNMTTVKNAINALSASGETYIPSGLAWGFNALSSPIPLTEAAPYGANGENSNPRKAIVLMTDGRNTQRMNHGNGRHDVNAASNPTEPNKYTTELCTNIKAKNIDVYTVAFEVTDNTIKKILEDCASSPSHYFDATNSAQLTKAFAEISFALRSLYIAR